LISSPQILLFLNQTINQLLQQNFALLSSSTTISIRTNAAVDLNFLVRMLPLTINGDKKDSKKLLISLVEFAVQLVCFFIIYLLLYLL
jgi:hypothetical protein